MKRAMAIAAGVIAFAADAVIATRSQTWTATQSGEHWTDPSTGERIKILESRPVHLEFTTPDRFMLIDQTARH